ncbi:MAG TPA: DUF6616 family protein [Acidimicrobiia bacterium]|jgi:hypothetical protein|nr:DUF6616 family protein [Acidimicrobiia bacterium]
MHVVVELWKARPGWFRRSPDEQAAYLETVMPHLRQLLADGAELVSIGAAERRGEGQPDYDYWTIWRFHDQDHLLDFTHVMETVGWHQFFERVHAGVEGRALEDILPTHGWGGPNELAPSGVEPHPLS